MRYPLKRPSEQRWSRQRAGNLIFFLALACLILGHSLQAQASAVNEDLGQPNPFSPNYLYVSVLKNTPILQTADTRQGGYLTYLFGYRHNLDGTWIMGLSLSFKSFKDIGTDNEICYFTFAHEALYIIRLYHPFYLLTGLKFLYLYPTLQTTLPLARNTALDSEVGAAATLILARHIDPKNLITIELNRWRGTKTNNVHGTEVAIGLNRSLK